MKRICILILVLLLMAVPVLGAGDLVNDGEGLLTIEQAADLEAYYAECAASYGFTPVLVTVDSFGGQSAEEFAGQVYDLMSYPQDGMLYLVSLTEGEWYILTNGACYHRISDKNVQAMGDELVDYLRYGDYYEAFARFPELAAEAFAAGPEDAAPRGKNYAKTIVISMIVGFAIGGIAVGIMSAQMKSVKQQQGAADYLRAGSMQIHDRRDIFLYSRVSRTSKPKSNSSGSSGGGSRGGAGGKI